MANNVFANGREISCKKADGKTPVAFPDVCFTPPQTPPMPLGIPIPYPNTGFSKDAKKGSKKVKISGKEIMLKNKSFLKKSTGDEAGRAPKKGLITSKNKGKVYFTSWSMNVKVEKKNAVRHQDTTTHNHASQIGNESIPWLHIDTSAPIPEKCKEEQKQFQDKCGPHIQRHKKGNINVTSTKDSLCSDSDCTEARKCALLPYSLGCCDSSTGEKRTPHHLIPNSLLQSKRGTPTTNVKGLTTYTDVAAPCCCVDGATQNGDDDHGRIHRATREKFEEQIFIQEERLTYDFVKKAVAKAHTESVGEPDGEPSCDQECLEAQLDDFFKNVAEDNDTGNIELNQKNGMNRKNYEKFLFSD